MINLEVALGSFWQLARHWKMGDTAKLELACEGGNLHMQLSAKLGHPDLQHFKQPPQSPSLPSCSTPSSGKMKTPSQLRRQDRRRLEALDKAAAVKAAADKTTADKAAADKAVADKNAADKAAAADKAIVEKAEAEKAKKVIDEKAENNASAKVKAKVTLASTNELKELARASLAAAAKALGTKHFNRELCEKAQKIAKTEEEIQAIATLWKKYIHSLTYQNEPPLQMYF